MKRLHLLFLAALSSACATLGAIGEGDRDLPSSGVGPFRKLTSKEILGVAPFVLNDTLGQYREPAALALDRSGGVALFLVARVAKRDVIVRTRAKDARSFYGASLDTGHAPVVALAADASWEGVDLSGPSPLRVGDEIWLYYAAAGGIGLARSSAGYAFKKLDGPVLAADPTLDRGRTPSAPSVAILPDGRFRMLFAWGVSIAEAASNDGITWTRVDADPSTSAIDPVLTPSAPVAPDTLAPGQKPPFDTGQVTDPVLLPRVTDAGRWQIRVLYTGYDTPPEAAARVSAIGFAARYGSDGSLARNSLPVLSLGKHERGPAFFEWDGGAMLYVAIDTVDGALTYPAIAAAFAPPTQTLDMPSSFADGP